MKARNLIDEFNRRINGMNFFLPIMKMFANPIAVNVASAPDNFQLELLHAQSDIELKQLFRSEEFTKALCGQDISGYTLNMISKQF